MSLVARASKPLVSGLEEQPGKANYFVGRDRSKWRTNVPTYAKVQYRTSIQDRSRLLRQPAPNSSTTSSSAPGADPNKIVLGFKGARKLAIDAPGRSGAYIRLAATSANTSPIIYQEIDGIRRDIDGGYVRKGANHVALSGAAYDPTWPLVIDPVVLSYSTYLGGGRARRQRRRDCCGRGGQRLRHGRHHLDQAFRRPRPHFSPQTAGGRRRRAFGHFRDQALNAAGTARRLLDLPWRQQQ